MNHPQVGEIYVNERDYGNSSLSCAIWRIVQLYEQPDNKGVACQIERMGGDWMDIPMEFGDICKGTWHPHWRWVPAHRKTVSRWINFRR